MDKDKNDVCVTVFVCYGEPDSGTCGARVGHVWGTCGACVGLNYFFSSSGRSMPILKIIVSNIIILWMALNAFLAKCVR